MKNGTTILTIRAILLTLSVAGFAQEYDIATINGRALLC